MKRNGASPGRRRTSSTVTGSPVAATYPASESALTGIVAAIMPGPTESFCASVKRNTVPPVALFDEVKRTGVGADELAAGASG